MKQLLILLALPFLILTSFALEQPDFSAQLDAVAADFKTNIFDQTKVLAASKQAESIAEAIEDAKNEDGVSKSDIKKLDGLKKEAEALTDFITAIGGMDGGFETVEKMNLANNRVKADISAVQKGDFCMDIILVKIGDYVCYLAENNSSKIVAVNYRWKGPDGTKSGTGNIKVFANSVCAMYHNRNDKPTNEIKVMGMTCK